MPASRQQQADRRDGQAEPAPARSSASRRPVRAPASDITATAVRAAPIGTLIRKTHRPDRRASVVELTDRGKALADRVKRLWCALAEETVTGLPARTVAELPGILNAMTGNVDSRRHGRRDGG